MAGIFIGLNVIFAQHLSLYSHVHQLAKSRVMYRHLGQTQVTKDNTDKQHLSPQVTP